MNPSSSIRVVIPVSYEHQIHFTRNVFDVKNPLLKDILIKRDQKIESKVLVVLDGDLARVQPSLVGEIENYFSLSQSVLKLVSTPILIWGGEQSKNTELHAKNVLSLIERYGLCRHSYVVAIGGGALLDVVGFAAAIAHRGMRLVRLPSTVLAQADAGVGVKNGINHLGKKNFIGTFAPPFAVINDFELLNSLPERERRSGYIEAIKVALIRDRGFFEWIEKNRSSLARFDPIVVEKLIRNCAELHVQHIAKGGDPFEMGSARPLDFGHWAAHKLEQLSGFTLGHGDAVAVGIALDVIYSNLMGYIDKEVAERILSTIEKLGFKIYTVELSQKDSAGKHIVLGGLVEFQEHLGGELTLTMLKAIGQGFEVHQMDENKILQAIEHLSQRVGTTSSIPVRESLIK